MSRHGKRLLLIRQLRVKAEELAKEGHNPTVVRGILQEDLEEMGYCLNTVKEYLRVALRP